MDYASIAELPETATCLKCGETKPIVKMIVIRMRGTGAIRVQSRCKDCNNRHERGHRREWKTAYLRKWRAVNKDLNESYWRGRSLEHQAEIARRHFRKNHAALLIQGRLRRRLGMSLPLEEARKLLRRFGPCYPTRFGLTAKGLKEAERIRGRLRANRQHVPAVEIRMMVYEDQKSFFVKPRLQVMPYQSAARQLRAWHARQGHVVQAA